MNMCICVSVYITIFFCYLREDEKFDFYLMIQGHKYVLQLVTLDAFRCFVYLLIH